MTTDVLTLNCEAFALMGAGKTAEAEKLYRQVLALEPANADALRYCGELVGMDGRSPEAAAILRRALDANPELFSTWLDYGQAAQMSAQTESEQVEALAHTMMGTRIAEEEMRAAGAAVPIFPPGHYNQALGMISLGDWKRGWQEYEWGYLCQKRHLRTRKGELWKGERLGPHKKLFVHWEGGYGDTICWSRFLPQVALQSGAQVILEVQSALYGLFKNSRGVTDACTLITQPNLKDLSDLPEFDYRISLQSLPYRLGVTLENIPQADTTYLQPNVAAWPLKGKEYKVGVCWKGNPQNENDKNRSASEAVFMEGLHDTPGVRFYSLVPATAGEASCFAEALPIRTFLDTAAVIKALDLVITVDTAVAHLAGAMGKPVWMLPCYIATDYRWGLQSSTTPLYPTMKLFRQKTPGDWASVLESVRRSLLFVSAMTEGQRLNHREMVTA